MKQKFIVIMVSFMVLLTSCSTTPDIQATTIPISINYVSTEVTYSEPHAQTGFRINMDSTETELAKYFFESTIDVPEREACIEATEKVLSDQALANTIPEIYIFSQDRYDCKWISNHKLYISKPITIPVILLY